MNTKVFLLIAAICTLSITHNMYAPPSARYTRIEKKFKREVRVSADPRTPERAAEHEGRLEIV